MLSHRFSAYSAMESKAFRLGEVLVLPVRSNAVHSAREIGWALASRFCHMGKSNITPIAKWYSPVNANMECSLSLRFNLI